jgi:uncharacterized protein involved in exopolysaccharide biosynthesis
MAMFKFGLAAKNPVSSARMATGGHTAPVPERDRQAAPFSLASFALGDVARLLRANAGLILAAMLAFALPMLAYVTLTPPRYTATTQLLIDPRDLKVVRNDVVPDAGTTESATALVESQARVLASDNVLTRVIETQGLDTDPEFGGNPDQGLAGLMFTLRGALGRTDEDREPVLLALRELNKAVRVRRAERTFVIDVAVTTRDREKSARIGNAVAEAYLEEQRKARSEQSRKATVGLTARLAELRDTVRAAENRVEAFKQQNNIIGAGGRLVSEQQLAEINEQLVRARARTAEARARFEETQRARRAGSVSGAIPEAVQSQTVGSLRAQLAEIIRQDSDLRVRLGDRHPAVIAIGQQVRDLRRLIDDEVARIAEAARIDFERARAAEASLDRSPEDLKRQAVSTSEAFVKLRELEREVDANRTVYESFLNRARELGTQDGLNATNARVITFATPPLDKTWPPRAILMAAALVFGLLAGIALVIGRALASRPPEPVPQAGQPMPLEPVPATPPPATLPPATPPMTPARAPLERIGAPAASLAPAPAPAHQATHQTTHETTARPALAEATAPHAAPFEQIRTRLHQAVRTPFPATSPLALDEHRVRDMDRRDRIPAIRIVTPVLPVMARFPAVLRKACPRLAPAWMRRAQDAGLPLSDPEDDRDPLAQAARELHQSLRRAARGVTTRRVVLVGSLGPGDASAEAALHLALAAHAAGERVLVVDGDSTHNVLSRHVMPSLRGGLEDVASGRVPFVDALERDAGSNLHFLPAHGLADPPSAAEIAARVLAPAGLYHLVIIDAGSIRARRSLDAYAGLADDTLVALDTTTADALEGRATARDFGLPEATFRGVVISARR